MPRKRDTHEPGDPDELLRRDRRAAGLKKLRSRLDQAMDEMLRLHERGDVDAALAAKLRAVWEKVHELELASRAKS
jgi:hypothetical protein